MNKKLRIFLVITLVIQLLVPSFLLIYHYSVQNTARGLETEYKFELDSLIVDHYYDIKSETPSDSPDAPLSFDIYDIRSWGNSRHTVRTTPKNSVIGIERLKGSPDTDTWFYGKCFRDISEISPENYSFADGIDVSAVRADIRQEYYFGIRGEREPAYLTAKIYKGVIIPTSIYFRGEKIIDINL